MRGREDRRAGQVKATGGGDSHRALLLRSRRGKAAARRFFRRPVQELPLFRRRTPATLVALSGIQPHCRPCRHPDGVRCCRAQLLRSPHDHATHPTELRGNPPVTSVVHHSSLVNRTEHTEDQPERHTTNRLTIYVPAPETKESVT